MQHFNPLCPLSAALTVKFQQADYEVPEGDAGELILVTNRPYSFPFTINVTTQDGSAVCKCQCNLLAIKYVRTSMAEGTQSLSTFSLCPSYYSYIQHLLTMMEVIL